MPSPAIDMARMLAANGRTAEAVTALRAAVDASDPGAAVELASWLLAAQHLPRDLAGARELLGRAARLGHADAALIEIALTANGSGGAADWAGALALLETAARTDEAAAEQLALLRAMAIDGEGNPLALPAPTALSDRPLVQRFSGFCTPAECVHVGLAAAQLLQPAMIVDDATGRMVPHPIRQSDNAPIGPTSETLPIQAINRRIAAATGTHVAQGEPLTVLRYNAGQQYKPHLDALPGEANQRVLTAILYLNEGYAGGETRFPLLDITVSPRTGDLLVFANTDADGAAERDSQHAGLPIIDGTKWIATRWIRARRTSAWELSEAARAASARG